MTGAFCDHKAMSSVFLRASKDKCTPESTFRYVINQTTHYQLFFF